MPILIPAICNNISCGAIFPSGFAVEGSGSATIVNGSSGPCPSCGDMGRVPSGEYSTVTNMLSAKLYNFSDVQLLRHLFSAIERAIKQKSVKRIKQSLKKQDKSWQDVWDLLPTNKTDAYAFLGLVLSFVATAIALYSVTGNPSDKTTILNQSYENYYKIEPNKENNTQKSPKVKPLIQAIRQHLT